MAIICDPSFWQWSADRLFFAVFLYYLGFQGTLFDIPFWHFKIGHLMDISRSSGLVTTEYVERLIHLARGEKVLLDADLATRYGVQTKILNRAVKRNLSRFPEDFMFQLTEEEAKALRCQIGTSKVGRGGRRYLPYAFTEQGVAMLSSVLRSERAVQVNVAIMRAFVGLRRMLAANETLARKLDELERRLEGHDQAIKSLFAAIRELMSPPAKPRREIGFHTVLKEDDVEGKTKSKRIRESQLSGCPRITLEFF